MTSRSTASFLTLGPLAAVALLFGVLGPFASYIRASVHYVLGRPLWPAVLAVVLGCAAAILCIRVLSSHGTRRALLVTVGLLIAPLVFGQWAPGLLVVGLSAVTVLIPILLVAIGLSLAREPHSAAGVAVLVACDPLGRLLVTSTGAGHSLMQRVALEPMALGIGATAFAGAAVAAWLLPWSASPPMLTSLPAPAPRSWLVVGSSLLLAVMSSVDIDFLLHDGASHLVLYVIQAVGLPIACALCLLPLAPRHRAALFFAISLVSRFIGALASFLLESQRQ